MSDPVPSEPDSALAGISLPAFPVLADPTVTFTAGPDTAARLARAMARYSMARPIYLAWLVGSAVLVIGLAAAAGGRGVALLALFSVALLAYLYWSQARSARQTLERQMSGGNYAAGAILRARYGADAVDFSLPAIYLRSRYADIARLEIRGSVVVVRFRSPVYHMLPRELFPDAVLNTLSSSVKISGKR